MFRQISSMSNEDIENEIFELNNLLELSGKVNVDVMLQKKVNLEILEKYNLTLTPNGEFFHRNFKGFLPQILEKMYDDRTVYKKKMIEAQKEYQTATDEKNKRDINDRISRYKNLQLAKKVSLNSAYGALGSQYFRFYDIRLALAITLSGQLSIRWIENDINRFMNNILKTDKKDYVIASDTDSIYLHLGPIVKSVFNKMPEANKIIDFMDRVCEDKLQPFIDKSYQNLADYVHAYDQKMKMKREVLADKAIWTAKKRYILNVYNSEGVAYKEPSIKIQGLEAVKSSTPSACREKIKTALKIIINKSEGDLHRFIEDFRNEFKQLSPEDIAFPRGMNGLGQYADSKKIYSKGTPIHVRGSLIYNHFIKEKKLEKRYELIVEGEKIKFIYLKEPNVFKSDVISFVNRIPKEFDLSNVIDYDTQFEKSFVEPLRIILECIGWKTEKISTLDAFFT
jgi:DNA polymerase elongation subunit (family B)